MRLLRVHRAQHETARKSCGHISLRPEAAPDSHRQRRLRVHCLPPSRAAFGVEIALGAACGRRGQGLTAGARRHPGGKKTETTKAGKPAMGTAQLGFSLVVSG